MLSHLDPTYRLGRVATFHELALDLAQVFVYIRLKLVDGDPVESMRALVCPHALPRGDLLVRSPRRLRDLEDEATFGAVVQLPDHRACHGMAGWFESCGKGMG